METQKTIIPQLSPEVILVDTMYEDSKKILSALVKLLNNMRLVREIVEQRLDQIELIKILQSAQNRVVVKQPRYAETSDLQIAWEILSSNPRKDNQI